ncbi:MAG: hypothetical protein FWH10_07195, partial [Oscillospiraceae bacterium]|nr:hypothetical protein [Oscillospiraceae bacterium]
MNMKKILEEMQKKMSAAQPPAEIEEDGGESAESIEDLAAKIPEVEEKIERLRAMKGMPGIDGALKMLEGQLDQLKAVAKMQSGSAAAAQMGAQTAEQMDGILNAADKREQEKQAAADEQMRQTAQAMQGLKGLFGNVFGGGGIDESMHGAQEAVANFQQMMRSMGARPTAQTQNPDAQKPAPQKLNPLTMPQFQPLPGSSGPVRVGDKRIEFGSYPQTADGGVRKILWRVLENKDGKLLMISERILDFRYWQFEK